MNFLGGSLDDCFRRGVEPTLSDISFISDLEEEGLVRRYKEGRRNVYELHLDKPLRHPIEQHRDVGELVQLILG